MNDRVLAKDNPPGGPARGPKPAETIARGAPPEAAKASGRKGYLALGLAVVGASVGAGLYAWRNARLETTDDAQVTADQVSLAPRINGTIVRVAVGEDQSVKAGDVLFTLDTPDYEARLAGAEADVGTAQAQLEAAEAQIGVVEASSKGSLDSARAALQGSTNTVYGARAQLEGARAAVLRATAESRRADQDYERATKLREQQAVSQERLEVAEANRDAARAALSQSQSLLTYAEEALRTAQRRVGEAQGRVGQSAPVDLEMRTARANADLARSRLASATAAMTIAKRQLDYTTVIAPTDGTVSKIVAHVGQYVSIGQPMAQLVSASTYLVANFKEDQIARMRPGQRVGVELDAFSGRKLWGRVSSLAAGTGAVFSMVAPDNATGNFIKVVQRVPVRIEWDSLPGDVSLRSGLSAEVTVHE